MEKINNTFSSIEQVAGQYLSAKQPTASVQASEDSFADILKQTIEKENGQTLKFSKHALQRLESRNINLTNDQSSRLENGVSKAEEKGIKESLVMVDSLAFIVNVPNKTVVTAMDQTDTDSNIFTNIDGAVII
jgi:flagellar operon protein